jgi:hypothetical protein
MMVQTERRTRKCMPNVGDLRKADIRDVRKLLRKLNVGQRLELKIV